MSIGLLLVTFSALATAQPVSTHLTDTFDPELFKNPPSMFWPAPFWTWNGPLDEAVLREQLDGMNAHGFKSVCMLPLPHAFRPDTTNNQMDPDYLTPEWFDRVRFSVNEAAAQGMTWWLYDEGGWPSGQALGKVRDGHPEFAQQRLVREQVPATTPYTVPADAVVLVAETPVRAIVRPGETWTPQSPNDTAYLYRAQLAGYADLLNPNATQRFIELTHDQYANTVGEHFGKDILFTFTDEPSCTRFHPPDFLPWTPGMDALYTERFNGSLFDILPELFAPTDTPPTPEIATARIQYNDLWTARFRDAYFLPLQTWARDHHLASAGHLGGEDETINAVRHGFGHAMRELRAFDVPGVDLIWRQLFPGKPGPRNFPKLASSAAHQNGTRYAFTESFCVYGNGLTPAQMRWLLDCQYARGINLLVMGCYPLSTRDHLMTGERPHFGPSDPLWDLMPGFNEYAARLSYALSVGKPAISTALYYPARDLWALGETGGANAAATHDALAEAMLSSQCDYDEIDDDTIANATISEGTLEAGAMRYTTIVCGDVHYMDPNARAKLDAFATQGGKVISLAHAPNTDGTDTTPSEGFTIINAPEEAVQHLTPTIVLDPPCPNIRVAKRITSEGDIVFLFNEGDTPYEGTIKGNEGFIIYEINCVSENACGGRWHLNESFIHLEAGESCVYFIELDKDNLVWYPIEATKIISLEAQTIATPKQHFIVGEHDFLIENNSMESVPFSKAESWKGWLGADFSGEVEYNCNFEIIENDSDDDNCGCCDSLEKRLKTGPIEYGASVYLDEVFQGYLLWPPWTLDLPTPVLPGKHTLTIRVFNTLANELISERVKAAWAAKQGPGWPSPYHVRALAFEEESRGGGLHGPILLVPMIHQANFSGVVMDPEPIHMESLAR